MKTLFVPIAAAAAVILGPRFIHECGWVRHTDPSQCGNFRARTALYDRGGGKALKNQGFCCFMAGGLGTVLGQDGHFMLGHTSFTPSLLSILLQCFILSCLNLLNHSGVSDTSSPSSIGSISSNFRVFYFFMFFLITAFVPIPI